MKGEDTPIAWYVYIDVLVCRFVIIVIGMTYGYSLPPEGSVKLGRDWGFAPHTVVCVITSLTWKLVGCGGFTTICGVVVKTNIWLTTWAFTSMIFEVLAPPSVSPIGCSYAFRALFWGGGTPWGDEFPNGLDILTNLPFLKCIKIQQLTTFKYE